MSRLATCLLVLFIILTRAALPELDPPYLSFSRGEYTDPGFYLNNARSLVLTGEPLVGDWDNRVLFPVTHALVWLAWSLFGYAPAVTAGLCALLAALTGILLATGLARHAGPRAGVLALLWFAVAAPLLLLGRVPLLENTLLPLFAALLIVRLQPATVRRHLLLLVLVLLATAAKYSALFILPALAIVSLAEWRRNRHALAGEGCWFWLPLALLLLAAAGIVIAVRPPALLATFADKMTRYDHPQFGLHELLLPVESNFFWRMPFLTLSAWLAAGLLFWQRSVASRLQLLAGCSLAAWYLSIVFIRYNPLRYQLVTAPFLIALAVTLWLPRRSFAPRPVAWFRLLAWFAVSTVTAYSAMFVGCRSLLNIAATRGQLLAVAAAFGAFSLALAPVLRRWRWSPTPATLTLLMFGILTVNGLQTAQAWQARDNRLAVIGSELARLVPPDATIGGWYAPSVNLHNRLRTYTTYHLTPECIARQQIGFLLLETAGPGAEPYILAGELAPLRGRLVRLGDWAIPRTRIQLGLFAVRP
ncbi:MAG TPA: hypothetical protein PKM88_06710 [bacterium]|nr:hypothetical protein [bacterium]